MSFCNFFRKINSRKTKSDVNTADSILVYDKDGNPFNITKESWISEVLPKEFKKEWNTPDNLYSLIVMCLNDNVDEITIQPTLHLFEIDTDRQRAYLILGLVYLKNDQLENAEKIFKEAIERDPKYGFYYTNLAKVYSRKGDEALSYKFLWEGISLDPNQENAIEWISAIHFEKGGKDDRLEILETISRIPGSWRAQLWIARDMLENGRYENAKLLYKKILDLASQSEDGIMMISGDLGKNGRLDDIFEIVYPIFDIEKHGINSACNIVNACIQSNRKEFGLEILSRIKKLDRLDYIDRIKSFENQLNK